MKTRFMTTILIVLILSLLDSSYASENSNRSSFEYAELVIMTIRTRDKSGNYESSTTIAFSYGDGKGIASLKSQNDPVGIDATREAFKDFIQKYDKRKTIPMKPSEISVLNVLGEDGWEIVFFSDAPAIFRDGTAPQSKYLFKRIK